MKAQQRPAPVFNLSSWIVAIYALGVGIGVAWWLVGIAGLGRIVWTARPAPPHCRELFGQIAGPAGERVRLIVSPRVSQPLASAWGRPVIVLPENLCGDGQTLRWCLAHEWTHVERHDFRVWLMAGLVRVLFFYHPLVWWLRRQLRLCQDYVADARAARQAPQPEDYAEFLTVRAAAGSLHPAIVGLGMGFRKSELYRRVVMLVENQPIESRAPRLWSVSVTLAALVLVAAAAALLSVPKAAAQGQPDTQRRPPRTNRSHRPPIGPKNRRRRDRPFTAKLPDGITVELLGVCGESVEGQALVAARRLAAGRAALRNVEADRAGAEKDDVAREFAVLLRNLPAEPVSVRVVVRPLVSRGRRRPESSGQRRDDA